MTFVVMKENTLNFVGLVMNIIKYIITFLYYGPKGKTNVIRFQYGKAVVRTMNKMQTKYTCT
jgi:hypothetical protein